MNLTRSLAMAGGIAAISVMGISGVAIASGTATTGSDSSVSRAEKEGPEDQAAQDAACTKAGVDPQASNIQYDDVTGTCSLDGGGGGADDE